MKITIFIIVLVLKWNENIEIWHFRLSQLASSLKLCNTYLKTRSKCLPRAFTKLEVFWLSMALLMEFCGRSCHIVCKTFFSSSTVFGLGTLNVLKIYEIVTT